MPKRFNRYSGLPCRISFDNESEDEPNDLDHKCGTGKRSRYSENLVRIPSEVESEYNGKSQKFDSDRDESDSPVEETAPRSASPVSDGSGGGKGAGSPGNETAPPSVSPVSDGSGGGEEAGSKTVNGKEPEEQESDTEVEKQLWCRVGKHIKGCTCPCSPHEHTPSCKCFETADGLDKMMQEWGNSQKHWARELIRDGVHLQESDEEP